MAEPAIYDGMMIGEIFDPPWLALNFQVGRRRTDNHVLARDAARDHACPVLQIAGSDGKIVAVLGKIGEAVAERQVKFQHRILPRQFQQHGCYAVPAEMRRHGDAQLATRLRELVGGELIGRFGLGQHQPTAVVIGASELGEVLPARGAVEQAHAETLLQKPDVFADHRSGQIECGRGRRERAEVDRPDEHGHALKAIHIRNSWFLLFCSHCYLSNFALAT